MNGDDIMYFKSFIKIPGNVLSYVWRNVFNFFKILKKIFWKNFNRLSFIRTTLKTHAVEKASIFIDVCF